MLISRYAVLSLALMRGVEGFRPDKMSRTLMMVPSQSHRIMMSIRGGSDGSDSDVPEDPEPTTSMYYAEESPTPAPVVDEEIAAVAPTPAVVETPVEAVEAAPSPEVTTSPAPESESKKEMNPKLANAIERTGPAVLLLGLLYGTIKAFGENALLFIVPLMQLGMYAETTGIIEAFHNNDGEKKDVEIKIEKWWWFLTVFASTSLRSLGYTLGLDTTTMDLACFGMVSIGLIVAVCGMASHSNAGPEMFRKYLGEVASFHFALLFLVGQSSFWIKTIKSFGMGWVLFPAFLVIVNDTMAYVFGVLMGNHKLLPRLSPKKTVEGFIGAGFSTVAVAFPLLKLFVKHNEEGSKFLSVMGLDNGNMLKHALALGFYTSLVAPFGGFLASAVKRAHGAKDFGALIPGHGGVVDRFDCQVVTAPFVYLYLKCFLGGETPVVAETIVEAVEVVAEAMK